MRKSALPPSELKDVIARLVGMLGPKATTLTVNPADYTNLKLHPYYYGLEIFGQDVVYRDGGREITIKPIELGPDRI